MLKIPFLFFTLFFLTCFSGHINYVLAQSSSKGYLENEDFREIGTINYPDSAFLALKSSYAKAIEQKDNLNAADCLQKMGQICFHFGHFPQAIEFHLQAHKLFLNLNNKAKIAENLNDLGILYFYNRQQHLAWKNYNEALNIFKNLKNEEGVAVTLGKIGHLYEKEQKYDSAFYFQKLALKQYKQIQNQQGIAKIYENLGSIYEDLEKYDSAYYYFSNSLKVNQLNRNVLAQIEVYNNLGDVLRKTGKYAEGLKYSRLALSLSTIHNERYQQSGAYRDLAKTYNLMNRNDSAYYYLELSRKMALEIYSEKSSKQVALLQVMYDIARKNNQIESLNHERKINQIIGIGAAIAVILLGLSGMLVISRQRMKIASERTLSEQNKHIFQAQNDLIQAELLNKKLLEEKLTHELDVKSRELSTHTLHVIQKNQLLEKLYKKIEEIVKDDKRDQKKQLRQIMQEINESFNHDQHWEEFRSIFEQVHQTFFDKLKSHSENLSSNDMRLVALLKMNLSSNDIASLLGISSDSLRVARHRLRKKLNLEQGESLTTFIQTLS